jgi:hypothetical protein
MKTMRFAVAVMTMVLGVTVTGQAGMFGGGGNAPDPNDKLCSIFGSGASFSAVMEMTMTDKKGKEAYSAEMPFAFMEGKVRTEIDMTKTKTGGKHAEEMETMRTMGLDKIIHIARPDKQTSYIVYPGMKGYCEMAQGTKATQSDAKPPKVDKTELGKETVDGHPCTKNKVVVTDADGQVQEFTTWEATDLKNFTIKTEYQAEGSTVTMIFRKIDQTKPAASLFEPPTECKRYGSMQEMVMGGMADMMKNLRQ